jgi:hypothetical protein
MQRKPRIYSVNYHLIGAIYFREGSELSGSSFANIWSKAATFGSEKFVCGNFWQKGLGSPRSKIQFPIGTKEHIRTFLKKNNEPIYGGGTFAMSHVKHDTTRDSDFIFEHTEATPWEGVTLMPYLVNSVSDKWSEEIGIEATLDYFKNMFEIADSHQPTYGLIDIASTADGYAGMVYGNTSHENFKSHRWVEQSKWVFSQYKNEPRARSVYWGNYLSTPILNKCGGREQFLDKYRKNLLTNGTKRDPIIWEFQNGVFISVTPDPKHCHPNRIITGIARRNLTWLVDEYIHHDAML